MVDRIYHIAEKYDFLTKKDLVKIDAREAVQEHFGVMQFSRNVWKKIDQILDFGDFKSPELSSFTPEEIEQFLKITAVLLKKGIIGWEYYEVNGQIEKHFVDVSIGDQRLANAVPQNWKKPDGYY